jgi:hypothetical protein
MSDNFGLAVPYNGYRLDADGKTFEPPFVIEGKDDEDAIALVVALAEECAVEIWQESRKVAVVPGQEKKSR